MTTQATGAADQQDVQEEYHDKPVPLTSRLGFKEPALVWSGFGIAYICAVIGGLIQQGLGTGDAILAILLGNFILFLYSAAIGYANGKWGLNFPLTVKAVFGETHPRDGGAGDRLVRVSSVAHRRYPTRCIRA
jgi:cytosine permease